MNSKDSERKHQGLNLDWVEKQMTTDLTHLNSQTANGIKYI